jgi:hypothetical protein
MCVVIFGALSGCRGIEARDPDRAFGRDGTIVGTVRGAEPAALDGRTVEVVNLPTGERQRTVTNREGAFTVHVPAGKYRIELALRDGERLASQPGTLDVNRLDAEAHADFVLGNVRVSRPRSPAYRTADGLGSPVA